MQTARRSVEKWRVDAPQKLISFLQARSPLSGKALKRSLEANLCRVNGRVERFASVSVAKGDVIELIEKKAQLSAPAKVLYEDEHLKLLDKPAGWVSDDAQMAKKLGGRHFLAHRLDKDTTGLLLFGKTPEGAKRLQLLFEERQVEKEYLALVDGCPSRTEGTIENSLVKKGSFAGQTIWGEGRGGLFASTAWQLVEEGREGALLLCRPFTGRTHQIRVHLAGMGHPILVDRHYASHFRSKLISERPLLHAARLSFIHPWTGEKIDISAPLPSDFQEALRTLQR